MHDLMFYAILLGLGCVFLLGWLIPSPLSWVARRKLRAENRSLREHLSTKMDIDAVGMLRLKKDHERLRQINEHLRITNQTLRNAPGRSELRLLHIYDEAVQIMMAQSPGFAPVWQGVVADVERNMQETEHGLRAFVKKVFRPSGQSERFSTDHSGLINRQNSKER